MKTKSNKRWTMEEEKVLVFQIQKNLGNLTKAFAETAELINRSEKAITLHYYEVIAKGKSKVLPDSYVYMTISANKAMVNKKIVNKEEDYINIKPSLWQRIKNLFGF